MRGEIEIFFQIYKLLEINQILIKRIRTKYEGITNSRAILNFQRAGAGAGAEIEEREKKKSKEKIVNAKPTNLWPHSPSHRGGDVETIPTLLWKVTFGY